MTIDCIVVGLGGMGAAAAWALARRGARVVGVEQFPLGHDRGSSHGHTRIIRRAYYESPVYVPLADASFAAWHDLEQATGQHLLTECPCLSIGLEGGELIQGVRRSAREHGLPLVDVPDLRRDYPTFRFDDECVGVVEPAAGVLAVDDCVRALHAEARRLGANLREGVRTLAWAADGSGVRVTTDAGELRAERLILAAGPWSRELLGPVGTRLTVMRQPVHWFRPADPALFRRDRFPIFLADLPAGTFYGLPMLDPAGVKVAQHYGQPETATIDEEAPLVDADAEPVRRFLARHLPAAVGEIGRSSLCRYTLTPDRHFVIDRHPASDRVAVAAGFSGHGFKFAPAVGEALADLALAGRTAWPIRPFAASRLSAGPSEPGA